eukprot:CAMPEP_0119298166 /NCGR_PEP_ID=MMETSP1333-20130426/364_1 /TAXON_ID=418940 /ORGANISM="Scyphosphaera apsteinii, Strain RCC1455" /LENGTH=361 /DNA_ID=CAMNT_0007299201 /DNA_START=54 /DNA_END=1138 /DNA_ORIENTATION=-
MVSSRAACVVLFVCAVAHSKAQLLCTPSATYRGKAASRTDITSTPSDDAYEFTLAGTPVKIYEQFGSFPSPVQEGIVRSGVPIPSLVAFDVCYENTAIGVDPTWTPQDIGVKERERPVGLKIQDGSKFDFYLSCEDSSCFDRVPDVTDILGFVPVTFDHAIISYEKGDDQGVVSSSSDVPDAIIKVSGEIHMEPSAKLCLGTFFANVVKFHLFRTGPSFYAETRSEDLSQATPPGPSQPFAIDDEDCNPTGQVANAEGTYQVKSRSTGSNATTICTTTTGSATVFAAANSAAFGVSFATTAPPTVLTAAISGAFPAAAVPATTITSAVTVALIAAAPLSASHMCVRPGPRCPLCLLFGRHS